MPKVSSQKKPESNYQIIDPCYELEEDKEEIQAINKTNSNNREDRMVMAMEMEAMTIMQMKTRKKIKKINTNRKIIITTTKQEDKTNKDATKTQENNKEDKI